MYVLSNTPKYFCEGCKKRVPCADLEAIFLDQVKGYFSDAPRIEGFVRQAAENASAKTDLLAAWAKWGGKHGTGVPPSDQAINFYAPPAK